MTRPLPPPSGDMDPPPQGLLALVVGFLWPKIFWDKLHSYPAMPLSLRRLPRQPLQSLMNPQAKELRVQGVWGEGWDRIDCPALKCHHFPNDQKWPDPWVPEALAIWAQVTGKVPLTYCKKIF